MMHVKLDGPVDVRRYGDLFRTVIAPLTGQGMRNRLVAARSLTLRVEVEFHTPDPLTSTGMRSLRESARQLDLSMVTELDYDDPAAGHAPA